MRRDAVFLVADKDMESALQGLISRHSLGIRTINCDIFIHPQRDPGCWNEAVSFLRSFVNQYDYAVVMFDHQGSGQDTWAVDEMQDALEEQLEKNGWDNRARVIVLEPELEIWVWSDSPKVDECLGWAGQNPDLRTCLRKQGLLKSEDMKPADPKAAMEWALREARKPRSAVIYRQLAEQVSLKRCTDLSFERLRSTLQGWFSL